MCGISGVINLNHSDRFSFDLLKSMTNSMLHRGPDDFGYFINDHISLGHRRLSIIDTSDNGKQPMSTEDERYWICFNGEIYNYREIRKILENSGVNFTTQTDTEVALKAYTVYGMKFLEHLNGMFAMCIYDSKTGNTILIRDRLGIKPLYFTQTKRELIFASEVKAILKHPKIEAKVNKQAISSYLSYRYPLGEQTFYDNIYSLNPGYYLKIDRSGKVRKTQYWELPVVQSNDLGLDYYLSQIEKHLQSSTNYRMIADVNIGAYLSGGVDSSGLVALMANATEDKIKTFTIGFEEKEYNEFDYSRIVAKKYRTDHHEILYSSDQYFDDMQQMISYKDAPLGIPNEPALYRMSKELKKHFTVVLSGEGADEVFGGYGRIFRSSDDYDRMNTGGYSNILKNNLIQKYSSLNPKSLANHFIDQYEYVSKKEQTQFLTSDFIESLSLNMLKSADTVIKKSFEKLSEISTIDQMLWIFQKHHLPGLLHRVDSTTMAASVEARVPFVDHNLVEFALTIPSRYKLKWLSERDRILSEQLNSNQISEIHDTPKFILKKMLEKYLPNEVLYRKKMGFPIPLQNWLGGKFREICLDHFSSQKARNRHLYNYGFIEKALNNKASSQNSSFGQKIWMLLNIEIWHLKYIDN